MAIAITPDGKTAYVVDAGDDETSGRVIPIQTATNTAGSPIVAGPVPYAIAIVP
jgi:DNA-binding beta-propeller fold protein YncE